MLLESAKIMCTIHNITVCHHGEFGKADWICFRVPTIHFSDANKKQASLINGEQAAKEEK